MAAAHPELGACAAQVWYAYSRWHAAEGGGGPAAATAVLARATKVRAYPA